MIIPAALVLVTAVFVWKWPVLLGHVGYPEKMRTFINILPVLPFVVFALGAVMGWRYNNTGLILTALIFVLSYIGTTNSNLAGGTTVNAAVIFLLPLNMALISLFTRKRLTSLAGLLCL